jgi:hypothetical protein
MVVLAGPPGSGKTRYFPVTAFGIDAFNIDDRCAQILGSYRAIPRDVRRAVAKECEQFVLDHIAHRESFAVETTLCTTAAIEQAEVARKSGFAAELRFVATDSIAENVARVLQRAQAGGARRLRARDPRHPSCERREPAECGFRVRADPCLRLDAALGATSPRRYGPRRPRHSSGTNADLARGCAVGARRVTLRCPTSRRSSVGRRTFASSIVGAP